jgi:hypothetical protein
VATIVQQRQNTNETMIGIVTDNNKPNKLTITLIQIPYS